MISDNKLVKYILAAQQQAPRTQFYQGSLESKYNKLK